MKTATTTTTTKAKHSDFARDFAPAARRALLKRGIIVIGICTIPGTGAMPWANGTRGYNLDDNGTHKIRTHAEVCAMAQGAVS